MPCSICAHPEVQAIAAALSRGDSLRTIEGAYGVNKSSVSRHTRQCLTAVSVALQAVNTPPTMGQPTAPAHLVNAAAHHEAMRLYTMLSNYNILIDTRRGLQAVVALLLQMVRDTEDDRTTGG